MCFNFVPIKFGITQVCWKNPNYRRLELQETFGNVRVFRCRKYVSCLIRDQCLENNLSICLHANCFLFNKLRQLAAFFFAVLKITFHEKMKVLKTFGAEASQIWRCINGPETELSHFMYSIELFPLFGNIYCTHEFQHIIKRRGNW